MEEATDTPEQLLEQVKKQAQSKSEEVHFTQKSYLSHPFVSSAYDAFDSIRDKIAQEWNLERAQELLVDLKAAANNVYVAIDGARYDEEELSMLHKQANKMNEDVHHLQKDEAVSPVVHAAMAHLDEAYSRFKETDQLEPAKTEFHEMAEARKEVMAGLEETKRLSLEAGARQTEVGQQQSEGEQHATAAGGKKAEEALGEQKGEPVGGQTS